MLLAVRALPRAGLQSAFDVNAFAFAQVLVATLREFAPGDDVEPFSFFTSLAFTRQPRAVDRQAEGSHGPAVRRVAHFRVATQVADQHYFVQTASHAASAYARMIE